MPEQRVRAILAQRLGSGEIRVRKIPAREKRREGPSRLPAGTSEPLSARKGRPLPRRDVVQTWARFGARRAAVLPSKDDAPLIWRNVPAWESSSGWTRKPLPSQVHAPRMPRNVSAWEGSAALGRKQGQLLHNVPRWKKNGRTRSWPGRKHGPPERSESDSRTALSVLCTSNFVLCSIHRPRNVHTSTAYIHT